MGILLIIRNRIAGINKWATTINGENLYGVNSDLEESTVGNLLFHAVMLIIASSWFLILKFSVSAVYKLTTIRIR